MRRGIAAFLGVFTLINCIGGFFSPTFDVNIWWIRTAPLPPWAARALLIIAGAVLVGFASGFSKSAVLRRLSAAILAIVAVFTFSNSIEFFALAVRGKIHPWAPVPMSFIVTASLVWISAGLSREPAAST